jgi:hypothetical protein
MASVLIRIYLDNCCFKRPYDAQVQARVRRETQAKLAVQRRITEGALELAWSYMLDFENQANPFEERSEVIARGKRAAVVDVQETPALLLRARELAGQGLRPADALHVACAMAARCAFFVTTDALLVKNMRDYSGIAVLDPAQFVIEVQSC